MSKPYLTIADFPEHPLRGITYECAREDCGKEVKPVDMIVPDIEDTHDVYCSVACLNTERGE